MSCIGKMKIIHEGNWRHYVKDPTIDGEKKTRGLIPRSYETHPTGFYAAEHALDIPLIPEGEWEERIADMEASKSSLQHIRDTGMDGRQMESCDQNGKGYCWIHSGRSALVLIRAKANLPYVDISAYAGACLIKDYRDEGGWGAQGLDWIVKNGLPSAEFWPQRSMSRSNDTPAMRANALLHRAIEGWNDVSAAQYDRNLSWQQNITLLLSRFPVISDYNWWGHSVCGVKPVSGKAQRKVTRAGSGKLMNLKQFERAWGMNNPVTKGIGVMIWNSWGNGWSDAGMGVLTGNQAIANGATSPREGSPSVL